MGAVCFPKRCYLPTDLHGFTTQKTSIGNLDYIYVSFWFHSKSIYFIINCILLFLILLKHYFYFIKSTGTKSLYKKLPVGQETSSASRFKYSLQFRFCYTERRVMTTYNKTGL
jgi:hypothetical protein